MFNKNRYVAGKTALYFTLYDVIDRHTGKPVRTHLSKTHAKALAHGLNKGTAKVVY